MSRRSSPPNSLQRWATALLVRANANLAQGENAEQVAEEVPVVPREVAAMAELIAQEEVPTRTVGAPQVVTMHLEYTSNDPIGKLMLQLVRDNMELREHSGAEAGTNEI
jgi:hypothetical protein